MASTQDNIEESRQWSVSRIASAAVLILILLGGIGYGVYSLVANNSATPTSSNKTSSSNNGSSAATSPNGSSLPSSASTNPPSISSSSSSPPTQSSNSSSSSSSQLSNTGPGDVALVGFIAATALGTLLHYGWRRSKA